MLKLALHASRSPAIHEFDTFMMHAKTVLGDDRWAILGSANMDNRSLELNDETCCSSTGSIAPTGTTSNARIGSRSRTCARGSPGETESGLALLLAGGSGSADIESRPRGTHPWRYDLEKALGMKKLPDWTWHLVSAGAALGAGILTRRLLESTWRRTHGEPPEDPSSPEVDWREAVAWTMAAGVAAGVGRLVARRGAAAAWRGLTGEEPPPEA